MKSSFTSFWWPGILSVILVALASRFQWLSIVEFVNDLISKSSIPGLIATLVLVVVLWGLISLYFRNNWATKELRIIAMSGFELGEATSLLGYIQKIETRFKGSLLQERFQLISQNLHDHNASDKVSTLLGGQSGVDSAHIHSGYGPLRALVWALPGLGFMGTAYEMAASIGGLGTALSTTQDYSGLRNLFSKQCRSSFSRSFCYYAFCFRQQCIDVSTFIFSISSRRKSCLVRRTPCA